MFWLRYLPVGADRAMSLVEHLEDLRRRIFYAAAGLLITFFVGLWQQDRLLYLLMQPAHLKQLLALTILEPLLVKFKLALVFGLVLSIPWILYQTLLFVAPALTAREARYVIPITVLSLVLSLAGVVFGYYLILPPSTGWLINQAGTVMSLQITALSYVSFAVWFLAILALTFQTPLVILSLVGLGIISSARLRREWRTVYVTIAALAAFITPDWNPVTIILVGVAMVGLYELSLLLVRLVLPGR